MSSQDNSLIIFLFVLYLMFAVAIFVFSMIKFKNTPAHGFVIGLFINLMVIGVLMSMGSR